jgi:hypothetical protein
MAVDPDRDWLDDMLAQQPAWDPPAGFATRVATESLRALPPAPAATRQGWRASLAARARQFRDGVTLTVVGQFEGAAWVARQYWSVVQR